MFASPKVRAMTAGCLLGMLASAGHAGNPTCSVQPITLYTTFEVWLDTPGAPTACIRDYFPMPPGIRQGWTTEEGGFGQSDPSDPNSWNSLSGLFLAVESCYGPQGGPMPTYPNFPPGTCGLFEYPRVEGEYETFNRQWVMKWYLSCGNPAAGTYEVRFDLYREDYCPDNDPPIMVSGFEPLTSQAILDALR